MVRVEISCSDGTSRRKDGMKRESVKGRMGRDEGVEQKVMVVEVSSMRCSAPTSATVVGILCVHLKLRQCSASPGVSFCQLL